MALKFVPSATPGSWLVRDATGFPVLGSVHESIGGGFVYVRGRWDGQRQVFDYVSAESLHWLSYRIENYLKGDPK